MTVRASRRLAYVAAAALAGIVLITAVVALYTRSVAVRELELLALSQNETLARTLSASLYPQIGPVLEAPVDLRPEQLRGHPAVRALRNYLVDPLRGMKVLRVKIYDRQGRTVFSTDAAQIGETAVDNEGFLGAMAGTPVAEMVHRDTFNASDGVIEDRDLLEAYVPIQHPSTGERTGVFEIYYDMTDLLDQIDVMQRQVVVSVVAVSAVVFLFIFGLFRRTESALVREEAAAASYLCELRRAHAELEDRVEDRTRQLASSEQRFKDVVEAAGEYIWETDAEGVLTFVSDRVLEVTGFAPVEMVGQPLMQFAAVDDRERLAARILSPDQTPFAAVEHRCVTKDGTEIWQSVRGVARHDEAGRLTGFRGASHDVTARKRAEERLTTTSLAIEQSSEMIIITDPDGVIEYVNPAFTTNSGYAAAEAVGQTPRVLRSECNPAATFSGLWKTIRRGDVWRGELCNRRKDGELFWNLVSVFPIRDELGGIRNFVGIQSDFTNRKRAEEALLMGEARLRAIMDSVPDGIVTSNSAGHIEMVNPAAERLFGYAAGELLGEDIRRLMPEPYRGEHDGYLSGYLETGRAKIIGVGGREVSGLTKDGATIPVELGIGEFEVGDYRGFVGVLRDLSERKRAQKELERARQQYFHRERTAALGQLAAGIVHEVANPVAAIAGAVEMLKRETVSQGAPRARPGSVEPLEMIEGQAERLAALTREVSNLVRPRQVEHSLLDLNGVVRDAVSTMRFDARVQDVDLRVDADPELPAIVASADQVTQVVINLLLNAVDACSGLPVRAGRVQIATSRQGESVWLAVEDNGRGMDEHTLPQALDAYFTTKDGGAGLGLGLSLCKDIVTEHHGSIDIESTPGVGTRVNVRLPVSLP